MAHRIRRNQSRIELLANSETVTDLLEKGFDRKKIFDRLREKSAISMAYSTFCKAFAAWKEPQKKKPAPAQNLPVPPSRGSGPQILGSAAKKSVDPKTYADDNLI